MEIQQTEKQSIQDRRMGQERRQEMLDVLNEYFNRGIDQKKFIDVSRIPLICQDITNIHQNLAKIEENMTWTVRIIIGAVILSLLKLIFIK